MKQTMPVWVGLTLLMLLLVATAAFIFLYQTLSDQQAAETTLQQTVESLESDGQMANGTLLNLSGQLTQQAGPLADYAATQTAVAAAPTPTDVVIATPTIAFTPTVTTTAVISESAVLTQTITEETTADSAPTSEVPEIEIIVPQDAAVFQLGETISITAQITDSRGLDRVWLLVDSDEVRSFSAENAITFTYLPEWIPVEPGRFELAIGAENAAGREHSTQGIVIFVQENDDATTETVTGEGE